jgi:hypothetical protein
MKGTAMIAVAKQIEERRRMIEFVAEALGNGDHYLPICSPSPPTCVRVDVLGIYEGELECEVEIIDEDEIPLVWIVEEVERIFGFPFRNALPQSTVEDDEALRASLRAHGPQVPILVDEQGRVIDGQRRQRSVLNWASIAPRSLWKDCRWSGSGSWLTS